MSRVRLRFLGSGDAFGSGGRFQTCLLLDGAGDGLVLIDCGASSLIAMRRAGVDPSAVGWVLLTHLHGDHFGGLPFLVLDGQFSRRTRPLVVAGPPGARARVEAARRADLFVCEAYFFDKKIRYHLDYATLRGQRERLDCKRIIVTHMSREMLARVGESEIESAEDGRIVVLGEAS